MCSGSHADEKKSPKTLLGPLDIQVKFPLKALDDHPQIDRALTISADVVMYKNIAPNCLFKGIRRHAKQKRKFANK